MNWKKGMALLLIIALSGFLAAGCGSSAGTKEQALRIEVGGEPESLDPAKVTGVPESNYQLALFEGLTALNDKDMPVPAAAEKWEISPDGLKYIFHIRPNAKWSNGDPVTAQDFEFAWKRLLNPATAAQYAYMLYPIKNAEAYNNNKATADQVGVKALDDKTLEVTLEKPTAYFLAVVAHNSTYPVDKKVVEADGDNWANNVKTFVGNGPFKLVNWVHNSKLEMVKNDQYWDKDKVKLNKLEWDLVEVTTTGLSMFENNQLDFMWDPPMTEVPRLQKEGKFKLGKYLGTYYYEFNNRKAPFDNPKVRKAFALAIDRNAITKDILKGTATPATAWIPPGFTDPLTDKDFREEQGALFQTDVAQAKKLLAEAGYPDGQGLPPITLIYNTNDNNKAIAEAVQEMWRKNLGVTVTIQNQEWKVFLENRRAGNFQVARAGWIGDYTDPMTFGDYFLSYGGNNWGKYDNPAYDKLIEAAQVSNDQKLRMQNMHEAEKILIDDMGVAPIYFYNYNYCVKPYVKGLVLSATGRVNVKEAYIQK
ncbi:Hypothetical protein LUCI_0448 [Lucifera butyrica]|uniref:Solute-binding protein family 5 domain-containing protein n=1 Tax=Lucifera butyrica TaxID=1351585 RepID=A0A498R1K9_9FIRM|nr:peptide ABC transporter substrate-binding protein [Lucifera butyrica]VBB05241.1 Hypothetical protein LUCI_0448 [Lucifera butyrica]